jgi:large subunit ribosomal protein L25
VRVPVTTTGRAAGVVKGGRVAAVFRDLPVRAKPSQIPSLITVDVTKLEIGETVNVSDLVLPEGVEVLMKPDRRVVVCTEALKIQPEEEVAAPGAAPAAPGAAPAAPAAT